MSQQEKGGGPCTNNLVIFCLAGPPGKLNVTFRAYWLNFQNGGRLDILFTCGQLLTLSTTKILNQKDTTAATSFYYFHHVEILCYLLKRRFIRFIVLLKLMQHNYLSQNQITIT